jgi:hypothetical protein
VRILLLGNSNDTGTWFEGGRKRHEILREKLAAEFGEPLEIIVKALWPTENVAERMEEWLDTFEPDLVYLGINPFWFQYESVPLRMKRILGKKAGTAVSNAGFAVARKRRLAHNAVFRTMRRWTTRLIGGDTYFTPQEVIERISACIRLCVRNESTILLVKGPQGRAKPNLSAREIARRERRRGEIYAGLKPFCDQLHVTYIGNATAAWRSDPNPPKSSENRVGDGLHSNAKGHERMADRMHELIREAILAHQEPHRELAATAGR